MTLALTKEALATLEAAHIYCDHAASKFAAEVVLAAQNLSLPMPVWVKWTRKSKKTLGPYESRSLGILKSDGTVGLLAKVSKEGGVTWREPKVDEEWKSVEVNQ